MSVARKNLLWLSEALSWAAMCVTFFASEGMIAIGWPLAIGFAWIAIRFAAAPNLEDVATYLVLSLAVCVLAAGYASLSSSDLIASVIFLKTRPQVSLALLSLGYGVFAGCITGRYFVSRWGGEIEPDVEELRETLNKSTFGTNTTTRKTHPILVAIAIVGALCLVIMLFN